MAGRPITVGTDGSEESLRAVDWAAREAVLRSSPLRIVSVLALPPRASRYQPPGRPDAVAEAVRESYTAALATAARRAADAEPGLAVNTRLLPGPPTRALAEATADTSMLVVGSRGGRTVTGLVLGSVSRYAATHARCPVVVRRGDGKSAYREIVVGLRRSGPVRGRARGLPCEEAALRQAQADRRARLVLFPARARARAGRPGARRGGRMAGEVPGRRWPRTSCTRSPRA